MAGQGQAGLSLVPPAFHLEMKSYTKLAKHLLTERPCTVVGDWVLTDLGISNFSERKLSA